MGLLFDLLFKPVGPGGVLNAVNRTTAVTASQEDDGKTATVSVQPDDDVIMQQQQPQQTPSPEWVLDTRDGGSLVWRRYDGSTSRGRRRVEFLDAVQVRVFERDEYDDTGDDDTEDDDGELCWADDWSSTWDKNDDPKTLFYAEPDQTDYPVLIVMSVTVLGLCIGVNYYLLAPVRWLFHQLLVD